MTLEELKDYLTSEIEMLEEQNRDSREDENWIALVQGQTLQWHCQFILRMINGDYSRRASCQK
jgi:hypothetical protein